MSERGSRRRGLQLLLAAVLVALAVVAVLVVVSSGEPETKAPAKGEGVVGVADTTRLFRGIPQEGIALGDPKAPLTMTEFADLQCPFCRDYAREVLPALVERYVRPGRMRLELRLLTFIGPDSTRAGGVAAAAAEQNRMWQFADLFYRNQGQENTGYADEQFLRAVAGAVPKLDATAALAGRNSAQAIDLLDEARAEAGRSAIQSTPSFLIGPTGGRPKPLEVQSLTPEAFTEPIDRLLASTR